MAFNTLRTVWARVEQAIEDFWSSPQQLFQDNQDALKAAYQEHFALYLYWAEGNSPYAGKEKAAFRQVETQLLAFMETERLTMALPHGLLNGGAIITHDTPLQRHIATDQSAMTALIGQWQKEVLCNIGHFIPDTMQDSFGAALAASTLRENAVAAQELQIKLHGSEGMYLQEQDWAALNWGAAK